MNSLSVLLVVASSLSLTWPFGKQERDAGRGMVRGEKPVMLDAGMLFKPVKAVLKEISASTDEVTPVPTLPPVPTIAMPETSSPPDPAANSRYKYWDYLNLDALVARARAMISDNESVVGKLTDLKTGSVSGLPMTDEQKWQRMGELNDLYWKMMLSSFATLDDINHADVYYSLTVDPPFECPPANGVYER